MACRDPRCPTQSALWPGERASTIARMAGAAALPAASLRSVSGVMVEAENTGEAPFPIVQMPHPDQLRQRAGSHATLVEPVFPGLHGAVALDGASAQGAGNDRVGDAAIRRA